VRYINRWILPILLLATLVFVSSGVFGLIIVGIWILLVHQAWYWTRYWFRRIFKRNYSNSNIEIARQQLIIMLMRSGLSADISGLASQLVHPMDNYPIPPRALENNLRGLSRKLSIQIRDTNIEFEKLDKTKHNKALAKILNDFANYMFEASKEQNFTPYIERFAKLRDKSQELLNNLSE